MMSFASCHHSGFPSLLKTEGDECMKQKEDKDVYAFLMRERAQEGQSKIKTEPEKTTRQLQYPSGICGYHLQI